MFFYRKPRHLARTNSHWTELYPSPEPSFLKKQVEKICDWVYGNIDSFFQGSAKKSKTEFKDNLAASNEFRSGSCQTWMLNQGVIDIVLKDINESLSWLLPGFIRQFTNRLHQHSLLYFFTDYFIEDDSYEWDLLWVPPIDQASGNKGNTIYVTQEFKGGIISKFLSISDWWVRFFHKLIYFAGTEPRKKSYYLSGNAASPGYDYSIDNQNCMIRGPDKSKLNQSFSFHRRN